MATGASVDRRMGMVTHLPVQSACSVAFIYYYSWDECVCVSVCVCVCVCACECECVCVCGLASPVLFIVNNELVCCYKPMYYYTVFGKDPLG